MTRHGAWEVHEHDNFREDGTKFVRFYQGEKKPRPCLRCGKPFNTIPSIRICPTCKEDNEYQAALLTRHRHTDPIPHWIAWEK